MKDRPETFDPDRPDENRLYSTTQIAELFSVTTETVRDWIKSGKLKGTADEGGRAYRVRRRDLIEFANKKYGFAGTEMMGNG